MKKESKCVRPGPLEYLLHLGGCSSLSLVPTSAVVYLSPFPDTHAHTRKGPGAYGASAPPLRWLFSISCVPCSETFSPGVCVLGPSLGLLLYHLTENRLHLAGLCLCWELLSLLTVHSLGKERWRPETINSEGVLSGKGRRDNSGNIWNPIGNANLDCLTSLF